MARPPRSLSDHVVDRALLVRAYAIQGVVEGIATMARSTLLLDQRLLGPVAGLAGQRPYLHVGGGDGAERSRLRRRSATCLPTARRQSRYSVFRSSTIG